MAARNVISRYGKSEGDAREALTETSELKRGHFDKLNDHALLSFDPSTVG